METRRKKWKLLQTNRNARKKHTEFSCQRKTGRSANHMKSIFRYHHLGIPTRKKVSGMVEIRHLKIHATDHESNPFGIQ